MAFFIIYGEILIMQPFFLSKRYLPKKLRALIFSTFYRGDRMEDPACRQAVKLLVDALESNIPQTQISFKAATELLKNKESIKAYINDVQSMLNTQEKEEKERLNQKSKELDEKIKSVDRAVDVSLSNQGINVQESGLTRFERYTLYIVKMVMDTNSRKHIFKWIIGVGLALNVIGGLAATGCIEGMKMLYNWGKRANSPTKGTNNPTKESSPVKSVNREKTSATQLTTQTMPAAPSLPPLPSPGNNSERIIPLEMGINGLQDPKTGKKAIEVLKEGQLVTLPGYRSFPVRLQTESKRSSKPTEPQPR